MAAELETDLVGKQVQKRSDKQKRMNAPILRVVAAFVGPYGLKVTIADEYGQMETVDVSQVDLVMPRRW